VELKQAKHQSQDLHRTGDFFGALLTLEPGQEPPKSPPKSGPQEQQTNGALPPAHLDPVSPFSQPPAPPLQQPLPGKPDVARFMTSESLPQPPFQRTKTETPGSAVSSPTRPEPQNGQIVSLLEALKSAKHEIDSQGNRVKYLEIALMRERKARETAEQRARVLSGGQFPRASGDETGVIEDAAFEPPLDSMELLKQDLSNGHARDEHDDDDLSRSSASMETLKDSSDLHQETDEIDASASRLQVRLDLMVQEMNEMKASMEVYKRRAEDAEEGRRSLAELVENIRASHGPDGIITSNGDASLTGGTEGSSGSASKGLPNPPHDSNHGLWNSSRHKNIPNGKIISEEMQQNLESTLTGVLQQQRSGPDGGGRKVQSAPYVSMVGIVLIGVGLMTWLNGWQPGGGDR